MNTIAFFLDNSNLSQVDFSEPSLGNPGSGATEYMTVLLANELSKRGLPVKLICTELGKFPQQLDVLKIASIQEAINFATAMNYIFVLRAQIFGFEQVVRHLQGAGNLKVVIWAHLTPKQEILKLIEVTPQVKKIICLENNQRVRMGDSPAHARLSTIPYAICGNTKEVDVFSNPNNVVYLGALSPQKGFHFVADSWSKVRSIVPDAKLFVLGSSSLYGDNYVLGEKGIASQEYEDRIFKNLDKDDASVTFFGKADSSIKSKILDTCKVGIVNPTGLTETFCLSAVEFQQRGIPVIGGRKFGLLDTVKHGKTGTLILHPSSLSRTIVKHLTKDRYNQKLGSQARVFVLQSYPLQLFLDRWQNVFQDLTTHDSPPIRLEGDRMKVRSMQGLLCIFNRYLVRISGGKWPTLVTIWENMKKTVRRRSIEHWFQVGSGN